MLSSDQFPGKTSLRRTKFKLLILKRESLMSLAVMKRVRLNNRMTDYSIKESTVVFFIPYFRKRSKCRRKKNLS